MSGDLVLDCQLNSLNCTGKRAIVQLYTQKYKLLQTGQGHLAHYNPFINIATPSLDLMTAVGEHIGCSLRRKKLLSRLEQILPGE